MDTGPKPPFSEVSLPVAPENRRRIERREGEAWCPVRLRELRGGDIFRMYEPDGEFLGEHRASKDAYPMDINGKRSLQAFAVSLHDPERVLWGIDAERLDLPTPRLATDCATESTPEPDSFPAVVMPSPEQAARMLKSIRREGGKTPNVMTGILPAATDIERRFNQEDYKRRDTCREDCPWVYPPDDDGAPCTHCDVPPVGETGHDV